jgi:hypothetical protein
MQGNGELDVYGKQLFHKFTITTIAADNPRYHTRIIHVNRLALPSSPVFFVCLVQRSLSHFCR